jgi:hypothetical protein
MDQIERQAVLDKLREAENHAFNSFYKGLVKAHKIIADMPSAKPEIIRCKGCKHHWIHRCMDSMPTEICELGQTFYDANVDFCSLAERRTDGV